MKQAVHVHPTDPPRFETYSGLYKGGENEGQEILSRSKERIFPFHTLVYAGRSQCQLLKNLQKNVKNTEEKVKKGYRRCLKALHIHMKSSKSNLLIGASDVRMINIKNMLQQRRNDL